MPDPTPPDSLESYIQGQKAQKIEGSIADSSKGFKAALNEAVPVHSDTQGRIDALNTVIASLGQDIEGLEGVLRKLIQDHGGSADALNGVALEVTTDFERDISSSTYAARRDLIDALGAALKSKGDEKLVPEKVLEIFVKGALKKENVTLKALGKLEGFTEGVTAWLTSGVAASSNRGTLEERALAHLSALPQGVLNKEQREALSKIGASDLRKVVKVLFDTLEAARSLLLHRLLSNDAVDAYFGVIPSEWETSHVFTDPHMSLVRAALDQGNGVEVTIDGHLIYLFGGAKGFDLSLAKVESLLGSGRHIVDFTIRPNTVPLFDKQTGLKSGAKLQARRVVDGALIQVAISKDGAISGSTLKALGDISDDEFRSDPRKLIYAFTDLQLGS